MRAGPLYPPRLVLDTGMMVLVTPDQRHQSTSAARGCIDRLADEAKHVGEGPAEHAEDDRREGGGQRQDQAVFDETLTSIGHVRRARARRRHDPDASASSTGPADAAAGASTMT